MAWIELLDNPEAVRAIFPAGAPSLEAVRIHDVLLHQDGMLILRLDLNDYPSVPPKKWVTGHYNTVQVRLMFMDAKRLTIQGWSHSNVGNVEIQRISDGAVELLFSSSSSQMSGTFQNVRLDGLSAYCDAR
jgi:hypothetical protein